MPSSAEQERATKPQIKIGEDVQVSQFLLLIVFKIQEKDFHNKNIWNKKI